jgi:GH24 family phage-related lysozyme (muramidase)
MDPVQEGLETVLKLREGVRYVVYRDSRGLPTGGIGHLIQPSDNLDVGDDIPPALVDQWFAEDTAKAIKAAIEQAAQVGIPSVPFIVALASVNFQLGTAWTAKFPRTWKLICNHQWDDAIQALDESAWNEQTPVRVLDFQRALRALKTPS